MHGGRRAGMLVVLVMVGCAGVGLGVEAGKGEGKKAGQTFAAAYKEVNAKAVAEVLAGKRTTASAAWWGFDEANATAALQGAIRSGAKRVIVPNMGKPWMVDPLLLESDQEIVFETGTVVEARKGSFRGVDDSLLTAKDKKNIKLTGYGAALVMHKEDYRKEEYKKGEWRMCLALNGCRQVEVSGLRLAGSGGDGIYVGRGTGGCEEIHIKDVTCEDNYRQGISIISVRRLVIEDCILRGTEGTEPAAGIDFEPNHEDEELTDCVVRNCTFEKNQGYGIQVWLGNMHAKSKPVSVRIENCVVRDNNRGALMVGGGEVGGRIELAGNKLTGGRQLGNKSANLTVDIKD